MRKNETVPKNGTHTCLSGEEIVYLKSEGSDLHFRALAKVLARTCSNCQEKLEKSKVA